MAYQTAKNLQRFVYIVFIAHAHTHDVCTWFTKCVVLEYKPSIYYLIEKKILKKKNVRRRMFDIKTIQSQIK